MPELAAPAGAVAPSTAQRRLMLVFGLALPAVVLVVAMVSASALTIDDAYISFRYARNLVEGHGLVYNPGERIEGYTNFLWTLCAAAAIALHIPPVLAVKLLGGAAAVGVLVLVGRLSARLQPVRRLPPLAPWLLASSATFAGNATTGLETVGFTALVVLGTSMLLAEGEGERPGRFPWSAVVYGLAALTRPEAPLFFGLSMLALARPLLGRQNLIRVAVFAAIVGAYLLWRHHYYGAWLPNTLGAKTGNLSDQMDAGARYLGRYLTPAGAVSGFVLFGAGLVLARRSRLGLATVLTGAAVLAYVVLVGGDWMPLWRFVVPAEPFLFLLADAGLRAALEGGGARNDSRAASRAARPRPVPAPAASPGTAADPAPVLGAGARRFVVLGGLGLLVLGVAWGRAGALRTQLAQLADEQRAWDVSARPVADWLNARAAPGAVALGDIGYVGWSTGRPVLDILGLVDPVIAALPGSYGLKQGPAYLDYFFGRMPSYFVLISGNGDCAHPFHAAITAVYTDPQRRFKSNYEVVHRVATGGDIGWCIYGRSVPPVRPRALFDFEAGFAGWTTEGRAFEEGPTGATVPEQQPITGFGGERLANSFHPALRDAATGVLTSPPFTIDRAKLGLMVAGGRTRATRVELEIDGRVVEQASGSESEDLTRTIWDVRAHAGRAARLRIVDEETGPWGHVLVDDVTLFD